MPLRKDDNYTIDSETNCWVWNCKRDYPNLYRDGKSITAHRWFYEQKNGKIPDNLEIDHLCFNKKCVNVDHLEAVTHLENMRRRKINKCDRESSLKIRELYDTGKYSQYKLADMFKINQSNISRIVNFERWV